MAIHFPISWPFHYDRSRPNQGDTLDDAQPTKPYANDRRASVRLRTAQWSDMWVDGKPPDGQTSGDSQVIADDVLVRNISAEGIGLVCHHPLPPNQVIEIEFRGQLINATVVRCRYLEPMNYEIGATINSFKLI